MPTLTIRLSPDQLSELQQNSKDVNQDLQEYIVKQLFPDQQSERKLSLNDVVELAKMKNPGEQFSLISLFPLETWQNFDPSNKRLVGRSFFKAVADENYLATEFRFIGKTASAAFYERL